MSGNVHGFDRYVQNHRTTRSADELLQVAIAKCGADAAEREDDLDPHGYSFEAECLPHRPAILSFAGRLTLSRAAADDLVQETYLKAIQAWPRFEPDWSRMASDTEPAAHVGQCAKAWLYRICMNTFVSDYHRARYRRKQCAEQPHRIVLETYDSESDGFDPRDADDGVGDQIMAAVLELDPDQRDVVVRADFRGERYVDIARDIGVPLGTVMSRLHRARRKLRPALAEYAEAEYGLRAPPEQVAPKRRRRAKAQAEPGLVTDDDPQLAIAAG